MVIYFHLYWWWWAVVDCTVLYWVVLDCTAVYWAVLSGVNSYFSVYSAIFGMVTTEQPTRSSQSKPALDQCEKAVFCKILFSTNCWNILFCWNNILHRNLAMPRGKGQDQIGGGFQKETGSLGNITTKISCVFSATAVPQNFCFKMASCWLCSLFSFQY